MISLFSRFDLKFYFLPAFIFLPIASRLILSYFKINFKFSILNYLNKFIQDLVRNIKRGGSSKIFSIICLSLFFYLSFSNYISVLSFNFPLNSQIRLILFSSLTIWLRFIFFIIVKNIKYFIRHCVPEGTPLPLVSLLFLIEIIRQIIRPLTLTVRLVANILAGHLLIILLSKISLYSLFLSLPYVLLNIVEIFVALIQAYIMITMVVLYYNEVC